MREMNQLRCDRPCAQPSAFSIVLSVAGHTAMCFQICESHYHPSLAAITLFFENGSHVLRVRA